MSNRTRVGVVLGALVVFAVIAGGLRMVAPRPAPAGQGSARAAGGLADLQGLDQLKSRFNADAGVPRLVLILAPT